MDFYGQRVSSYEATSRIIDAIKEDIEAQQEKAQKSGESD